ASVAKILPHVEVEEPLRCEAGEVRRKGGAGIDHFAFLFAYLWRFGLPVRRGRGGRWFRFSRTRALSREGGVDPSHQQVGLEPGHSGHLLHRREPPHHFAGYRVTKPLQARSGGEDHLQDALVPSQNLDQPVRCLDHHAPSWIMPGCQRGSQTSCGITSSTPSTYETAFSTPLVIASSIGHPGVVRVKVTFTVEPSISRLYTSPRVTMSRPISGSITVERASHTTPRSTFSSLASELASELSPATGGGSLAPVGGESRAAAARRNAFRPLIGVSFVRCGSSG